MNRPRLLLLDEPLSALDANLRRQMQVELKSLQREVGISFVFVTHDQEEAMVMSDRIALLRMGELEQVASPREIYNRPATAYTAQFIGHTNLLQWRSEGRDRALPIAFLANRLARWPGAVLAASGKYSPGRNGGCDRQRCAFAGKILRQAFHGATELLQVECADGLVLSVRTASRENWSGDVELRVLSGGCRARSANLGNGAEPDVLPRLSSRDHRAAAAVGRGVSARSLRAAVLLQLLVGLAVADHRSLLDSRQLPPTAAGECLLANPVALHVDRGPGDDLLAAARLSAGLLPLVSTPASEKICSISW